MIYLDNAATTAVCPQAVEAMLPYLTQLYGNPGSAHAAGRAAAHGVAEARATVAGLLGCEPHEVVFTSGGSEADNQAIQSAAAWGASRGRTHIVSTAFEHPAVLRTLEHLAATAGFQYTLVGPDADGVVQPQAVAEALRPTTALVSVMAINNELGTAQPVQQIAALAHANGSLFHTDAVQAVGHLPFDVTAQDIDFLALSAHKFHGPKGVGALLCHAPQLVPVVSVVRGGGQEDGRRAGTTNAAGIAGLAAALQMSCDTMSQSNAHTAALRARLLAGLADIPGAQFRVIGDSSAAPARTVCVCFRGVSNVALLGLLDDAGICASGGSACHAGARTVSPVLASMGIGPELGLGAVRFSFDASNTAAEVDRTIAVLRDALAQLRARD